MSFFSKYHALTSNIILCCILLTSCTNKIKPAKTSRKFKTLPEIHQSSDNVPSLPEKFAETRKKTEFLDDHTETVLNRNKKWFFLGLISFIWLVFQSFSDYRKD